MTTTTGQRVLDSYNRSEMLELAVDLARLPSFTTQETSVAQYLARFLGQRGLAVELQEVEAGRLQCIARLPGVGGGRSLMLNGHTDIDPLTVGWRRNPWEPVIEGDLLYGHGLLNMKGGVAAMVEAALALQRGGGRLRGDLVIAAVVGELQAGVGTMHLLERGVRTDGAIVTEPYGARNVTTVHAGRWQAAITTYGRAVHHSRREQGVDAIAAMVDVVREINRMQLSGGQWAKVPGIPRLNIGSLIGGHGPDHDIAGAYYVSDICTAVVDIRHGPGQSAASMTADLKAAIERVLSAHSGIRYEVVAPPPAQFRNGRHQFPVFDLPLDQPIVGVVARNVETVTGKPPESVGVHLPGSLASDDTGHLWAVGIPCVLYGPTGPREPTTVADGCVSISEMETCAKVIALSALEFCQ
jgi:acetylornithine deacetylase/succinyl-diaminopimelate desuccinylase-like protein